MHRRLQARRRAPGLEVVWLANPAISYIISLVSTLAARTIPLRPATQGSLP